MSKVLENPNPKIYPKLEEKLGANEKCENVNRNPDEFDSRGIFELLRNINDPEHPLTLEQLNVVEQSLIEVNNDNNEINVKFTPTIPHCSMATLIGLSIRTQLLRTIPSKFKVSVKITPGTHVAETAVNKQLADKERVAAALENQFLLTVIDQCLDNTLRSEVEENCCSEENENCCSEEKENRGSGEKESCCSEGKENCCSEEKENRGSDEKENCCSEGKENCCSEKKENRC